MLLGIRETAIAIKDDEDYVWYDDYLDMNGGAIFNFTLEAVPTMMKQVLGKESIFEEDVDYFVFHQANKFMLNTIRKSMCFTQREVLY